MVMPQPNTKCKICEKPIYIIPSRICGHNCCSIACRNTWFSKEKHPKWKGGVVDRNKVRQKDRQRTFSNKLRAIEHLGGKCVECGYNKCPAALDFHHRDPHTKDATVRTLIQRKWQDILIEINKCVLLCSNCHREYHWYQTHEK